MNMCKHTATILFLACPRKNGNNTRIMGMGKTKKPTIGFVGQRFVGKNYADDFEERGFPVIRYALEEPYRQNKDKLKRPILFLYACRRRRRPKDLIIPLSMKASRSRERVKSLLSNLQFFQGLLKRIQARHPDKIVLAFPEFLSVATAKKDVEEPLYHVIGMAGKTAKERRAAKTGTLHLAPGEGFFICDSNEAELIKYSHNANGYVQTVLFNILYDLSVAMRADWNVIERAMDADPYVSSWYIHPLHKKGRGAGGGCFIKDFAALRVLYEDMVPVDELGRRVFRAIERKNVDLLVSSKKTPNSFAGFMEKTRRRFWKFATAKSIRDRKKPLRAAYQKGLSILLQTILLPAGNHAAKSNQSVS